MQKNSSIKQNILHYLDLKGISKYQFYKDSGITRGVLDQNGGMSEENTAKFIAYEPNINPEWLITGEGAMLKNDKDRLVTNILDEYSANAVPLVCIDAVGGFGNSSFSIDKKDIIDHYVIPDFSNVSFMIRVRGNSMEPTYLPGDIVACKIIKDSAFIQWNRVHVIATTEQGILIKRIIEGPNDNVITAVSDNSVYASFNIPKSEVTGLALVMGGVKIE
jgi:phage repressor protein C with HTH and peptisase S24 domain